jgi:hypothetical protein
MDKRTTFYVRRRRQSLKSDLRAVYTPTAFQRI